MRRLPDPADPAFLASVTLTGRLSGSRRRGARERDPGRRTDRRRFTSWPVPAELIGELTELADLRGLRLQAITEPLPRYRLFRAISDAAERQANDPAQAAELAAWSGRAAGSPDGVPAVARPAFAARAGAPRMRPFADPQVPDADHGGEPESAALLLLSTTSDWPIYWLAAGEVASAVLLTATRDGLASSVLSQPLEVGDTRAFLYEHVVRAQPWHPQLLLRLGWLPAETPPLPPTPRRPLEELLVVGDQTG